MLWNAKIEALRNVGLEVLEIVKKRNTAELWDASDNLDQPREAGHRVTGIRAIRRCWRKWTGNWANCTAGRRHEPFRP